MAQGVSGYRWWGDSEEDDITKLSKSWEIRVADDNRVFFVDHDVKTTQWSHPVNGHRYRVPPAMQYGWQKFKDKDNALVFVDHISQLCSLVDPRLLNKTSFDFPDQYGIKPYTSIRNRFRALVKGEEILKDAVDLKDKVAVVTGANSGLGYRTALHLVKRSAHVILACRNLASAAQALTKIRLEYPYATVETMHLDLASLHSVKNFADEFITRGLPLHILVCNAGVFGGPFSLTEDGFERHFAVNHLGHFYLCQLLLDVLERSKPSRVVVVSSESHWYPSYTSSKLPLQLLMHPSKAKYSAITSYGASKLCNLLFMQEFHRRYVEQGISCNTVHPGNLLPTGLTRSASFLYKTAFTIARPFTKSVEQAVSTVVYCAAHPSMESISGLYMYECWPAEPSPEAQDYSTATALWDLSQQMIAEKMEIPSS